MSSCPCGSDSAAALAGPRIPAHVRAMTAAPRITRLVLQDFRSYLALDLVVEGRLVALAGENGAGKTNILDALSLFMAGRGLRRADHGEMARKSGPGTF